MTKNLDSEGLRAIIENYDLFFIDLWGVVHNGIKLHEEAIDVLDKISKGNKNYIDDDNLVRVFYSDDNFERKDRANSLAKTKGVSVYEIAIAYVLNQKFPVVALVGAESPEEVITKTKAGSLSLSTEEIDWISSIPKTWVNRYY